MISLIVFLLLQFFSTSFRNLIRSNIRILKAAADDFGVNSPSFDSDFAEMISKPLPEWYREQVEEQAQEDSEIKANRDRIMQEFRDKYEITASDDDDAEDYINYEKKVENKNNSNWLSSIFSSPKKNSNEERTTKEKWDDFLENERKDTGFYLPGFFEVFPELKLKWPIWAKRRDGSVIKCETDQDCQFPQACCPHPILPGDKFCCTGFGRRILVPAFATRRIVANQGPSNNPPPPTSDRAGKPF